MTKKQKTGVVITYHNRAQEAVIPCLDSVLKHTPAPRYILVYDNESTQPKAKKVPSMYSHTDTEFIRIDDQFSNGGLTGTWNHGIKKCLDSGCEKIILLNHDTVVDESWPLFIEKIRCDDFVYGPITNNAGYGEDYGTPHQVNTKEYTLQNKNKVTVEPEINGFCMGFTGEALKSNKYDENHFFNPHYPFQYNEIEWQNRWKKKKGKIILVHGAYVYHKKYSDWSGEAKNCTYTYKVYWGIQ